MTLPPNLYPWNLDDTGIFMRRGSTDLHTFTQADMDKLASFDNDEMVSINTGGDPYDAHVYIWLYFAVPMDISAAFYAAYDASTGSSWILQGAHYSTDSIGPDDAFDTWTATSASASNAGSGWLDTNDPTSIALTDVKAIRANFSGYNNGGARNWNWRNVLVWGRPSASANASALAFWDPSLDQEAANDWSDFGDITAGGTATTQVRVKNLSASQQANDVTLDVMNAYLDMDASVGTDGHGVEFSDDGGSTWQESLTIPSIAAGAISGTIDIRRTVEAGSALDNDVAELRATVGSWS